MARLGIWLRLVGNVQLSLRGRGGDIWLGWENRGYCAAVWWGVFLGFLGVPRRTMPMVLGHRAASCGSEVYAIHSCDTLLWRFISVASFFLRGNCKVGLGGVCHGSEHCDYAQND